MLNAVHLMGRLSADPDCRTFTKGDRETSIARYRLAVERDYRSGEERPVDFITCKAFGPTANYAKEYFHKGDLVAVSGSIVTECYEKKDTHEKQYATLVQVAKSYLAKKSGAGAGERRAEPGQDPTGRQGDAAADSRNPRKVPEEEFPPILDYEMGMFG